MDADAPPDDGLSSMPRRQSSSSVEEQQRQRKQSDANRAAMHRRGVPPAATKTSSPSAGEDSAASSDGIAAYAYRDFSHVEPPLTAPDDNGGGGGEEGARQRTASIRLQRFPTKLYDMLLRSKSGEFSGIITWMPHGRSWRIDRPHEFEVCVMPHYFEHCNYHSFNRLVNAWSFRRISRGPDKGSYYHELFLRGKPHLHAHMHRLSRTEKKRPMGPGSGGVGVGGVSGEPDFYAIAKIHPLPEDEEAPPPLATSASVVPSPQQRGWLAMQERATAAAHIVSSPTQQVLHRPGLASWASGWSPIDLSPTEAPPTGISMVSPSLALQGQRQVPPPPLHQSGTGAAGTVNSPNDAHSAVAMLLQQQQQGGSQPHNDSETASLISSALQLQQQQLQIQLQQLQQQQQHEWIMRSQASSGLSAPQGQEGQQAAPGTARGAPAQGAPVPTLSSALDSSPAAADPAGAPPAPSPSLSPANADAAEDDAAVADKIPDSLLAQPYAAAVRRGLSSASPPAAGGAARGAGAGAIVGAGAGGDGEAPGDAASLLRYQAQLQAVLEQYRAQRALAVADAAYLQAAAAAAAAAAARSRQRRLGADPAQRGQRGEFKEGDVARVPPPPRRPRSGSGPNQTSAWGA